MKSESGFRYGILNAMFEQV